MKETMWPTIWLFMRGGKGNEEKGDVGMEKRRENEGMSGWEGNVLARYRRAFELSTTREQ